MRQNFERLPDRPKRALHTYRGWRRLRSMRTALMLLAMLAAAAVVAGLVPQRPNVADRADSFFKGTIPWLHPIFDALGLFDVYGSLWFQLVLGSLIGVLLACLIPRSVALVRSYRGLRTPPRPGPFPPTGRRSRLTTTLGADEALDRARSVLRRQLYRLSTTNADRQFVAERGAFREIGSLIFHWSLLVLIAGAALSQGLGFRGIALIVEGEAWTENIASYNTYKPGRFYRDDWHRNFVIEIDSFDVAYRADGSAADFVTKARVIDGGVEVRDKLIRVNDPLVYGGVKFYQADYGWAPVVRVSAGGSVEYEGPAVATPLFGGPCSSNRAVVKLPQLSPQVGLLLDWYPDPILTGFKVPGLGPGCRNDGTPRLINLSDVEGGSAGRTFGDTNPLGIPLLEVTAYTGDLEVERPRSGAVFSLDTSKLTPFPGGDVITLPELAQPGLDSATTELAGVTVELIEVRRFTVLQVKGDPGVPVVAVAGALIMIGLVPSLVQWRRRLWVHVTEGEGRETVVELGGVAYQRKERFDDEFASVANRLRSHLPPVPEREPVR